MKRDPPLNSQYFVHLMDRNIDDDEPKDEKTHPQISFSTIIHVSVNYSNRKYFLPILHIYIRRIRSHKSQSHNHCRCIERSELQ